MLSYGRYETEEAVYTAAALSPLLFCFELNVLGPSEDKRKYEIDRHKHHT